MVVQSQTLDDIAPEVWGNTQISVQSLRQRRDTVIQYLQILITRIIELQYLQSMDTLLVET